MEKIVEERKKVCGRIQKKGIVDKRAFNVKCYYQRFYWIKNSHSTTLSFADKRYDVLCRADLLLMDESWILK